MKLERQAGARSRRPLQAKVKNKIFILRAKNSLDIFELEE